MNISANSTGNDYAGRGENLRKEMKKKKLKKTPEEIVENINLAVKATNPHNWPQLIVGGILKLIKKAKSKKKKKK